MAVIELKSLTNARDLGGTLTGDGYRLRPRLLLRSARLSRLSPADADTLRGAYALCGVLDLRTPMERAQMPDVAIDGVAPHDIPLVSEAVLGITHEEDTDRHLNNLSRLPGMEEMYARLMGEDALPAWRRVFALLQAERPGALLWHCTAGKDRAGLVAAMTLYALDVPREAIYADYLKTNEAGAAHAEDSYRAMLQMSGDETLAGRVRDLLLAKAAYLDAAFDAAVRSYGSVDGFLEKGCGLSPAARTAMKERYCEKAE